MHMKDKFNRHVYIELILIQPGVHAHGRQIQQTYVSIELILISLVYMYMKDKFNRHVYIELILIQPGVHAHGRQIQQTCVYRVNINSAWCICTWKTNSTDITTSWANSTAFINT